jgi:hypothetical protein
MEKIKKFGMFQDIRRVTPDGRVYILRKRLRTSPMKIINLKTLEATVREVHR